jgi:hypothetical protein
MDENDYFWLQCQAPAGNWVDNLGSKDFDLVLNHKRYLTGLGSTCRIVTKTIDVLPECVEEHGPNNACSRCAS